MKQAEYVSLTKYAGVSLAWSHPWPVPARVPFPLNLEAAIYIAYGRDRHCRYVGSVARIDTGGLSSRIADHLRDSQKRETWTDLWVLPLKPDTPLVSIRKLEGVIGAHLRPIDNIRLPRTSDPRRHYRGTSA